MLATLDMKCAAKEIARLYPVLALDRVPTLTS
jgi:hypothetical protein